jgi:formylglycine-generating enzyme required for sulfatase activity
MALVPAGPFEMGRDDGPTDEQPIHTVTLDAFYIDLYEVTNAQYAHCVEAGVCDPTTDTTAFESSYSRRIYFGNPEYQDYPVIYADWYEAQAYCAWRGGHLPTEAEWEKAAQGGLKGKLYPWGNEAPICQSGAPNGAKFDDDAGCNSTDTERVGSYGPNGFGLYDMAGNLWEWVADWYDVDYYANSPAANPTGPEDGSFPVLRGGSWQSNAEHLRVTGRRFNDPKSGALNIGFRCARYVTR